jgi:putative acetyltransferase
MSIREERESDIERITYIHNQTFHKTEEGEIVLNLRKHNHLTISLVYEFENSIVGHIAYSPVYENNEIIGLGLGPVAVLPEFQRQGIGSALIQRGNESALSIGFSRIFVVGDSHYYARFGFEQAGSYNYFSKYDPEGNHFMVFGNKLKPASHKTDVQYCKEFDG